MKPLNFDEFCGVGFLLTLAWTNVAFVLLWLVTVRRLRHDPLTRGSLGLDIFPGWQTMNVASTLSWPRAMGRHFDSRPLAVLRAHSQTLYAHTSRLDRCLARSFYWAQILLLAWLVAFGVHQWLT
jgi:hypothetical protein